MSATTQQIIDLAKRGFSSAQIAQALGMSEEQVTCVVTQDTAAVKEIKENGLDAQFAKMEEMALRGLEYLAVGAENETVRAKALIYILDQRQGRLKPRERETVQNNYLFLVDRASQAKERAALRISQLTNKQVPIEAEIVSHE